MRSVPVQRRPPASCRKAVVVCLEVRAVTHCWGVTTRRTRGQERGPRACRELPQRNEGAGLRAPEAPRASQERRGAGTGRGSGLQGLTPKRRPKPGTECALGPAPTEPKLLALEKTRARLSHTGQEEASGAVLRARAPSRKGARSGPGPGRASHRTRTSRSLWPTGKPCPRHSSRNEGVGLQGVQGRQPCACLLPTQLEGDTEPSKTRKRPPALRLPTPQVSCAPAPGSGKMRAQCFKGCLVPFPWGPGGQPPTDAHSDRPVCPASCMH